MKKYNSILFLSSALFLLASFAPLSFNKLKKGFEALYVFNYFEAKEIFTDQLKKEKAGASYGLSIIFSRNDNPFFHVDSAYNYILIADSAFQILDDKERLKLSELGVDNFAIKMQRARVDSITFFAASQTDKISMLENFIANYPFSKFLNAAVSKRNQLAFDNAKQFDAAESYLAFINTYPGAEQINEAVSLYQQRLYDENIETGTIEEYKNFITKFPRSPFVGEAQYAIYEKSTREGDTNSYREFIRNNPQNIYVENAWRKIFALEVQDFDARSIASFSIKFPDYPFTNELKQNFEYAVTTYYPFEQDEKWGFIDEKGGVRIPAEYEFSENFSEGLALVSKNGKVGFIDKGGNVIVPLKYDDALSFKSGYALVEIDGLYGIVDRTGSELLTPTAEDCGEFSEGFFYISKAGKYGFINRLGELVIDYQYDNAGDFHNGLAVVEQDGKKGIIDSVAKVVVEFEWDWIESFEGNKTAVKAKKDNKFTLISHDAEVLSPPVFDVLGEFRQGKILAAVAGKYGFLNEKADTIFPFVYDYNQSALNHSFFENNYAKVYQKNKVGIIDTAGSKIYPAIFEDTGVYTQKLTPVKKNGKWGYADTSVNLVIPYKYEAAANFELGIAPVKQHGKFGIIDSSGAVIIPFIYEELTVLDSNFFLVKDTAFGIVDKANQHLVAAGFQNAEIIDNSVIRFSDEQGDFHYYDYRKNRFIWRSE